MASMTDIEYGKPVRFVVPEYDYEPVRATAQALDLSRYYANLLDGADDTDEDDETYGSPTTVTRQLVEASRKFDWTVWSDRIKGMGDHYKLSVSGIPDQGEIGVHFIHRKSDNPNAMPLLLVHGWPGSFMEFMEISEILCKDYHLVMPSIPGFAFSDAPKKPAKGQGSVPWNYSKNSVCFNAIMLSLGYEKYLTQAGDWGSMLTRYLALSFPENVKAVHVNFFSAITSKPDDIANRTPEEQRGVERLVHHRHKNSSHAEIQGTIPYTLGAVLSTSPMALVFYIGEKFHTWSSPTTHPSSDAVIASCMLYWFSGSITSSFWLYYMRKCGSQEESDFLESQVFEQPFAFGCGSHEIHWPTRSAFDSQIPKLRQWRVLDKGGHFLAEEAPATLAADMNEFFQSEEIRALMSA